MHVTTHSTNLNFTVPVSTNPNTTNKPINRQTEQNQLQQHQGQQTTQQHDEDSEMADCDTEEEVQLTKCVIYLVISCFFVYRFQPQLSVVLAQSIISKPRIKYLSSLDQTVKMVPYNIFKRHRLSYLHRNIQRQHIFKARRRLQALH